MNFSLRYPIYVLLVLYSSLVYAGTSVGNGGLVVNCPNADGTEKLRILDFVEGELRWRFEIEKHKGLSDPNQIVALVLEKMATFDPIRAARLREELDSFYAETGFYRDIVLTRTDDEQNLLVPRGCSVEQAAVQINPLFPEDRRYNISADIWEKLGEDPNEQAGLILHELLYREGLSLGQVTSLRIRYFVSQVFSVGFENLSQAHYRQLLRNVDFPDLD